MNLRYQELIKSSIVVDDERGCWLWRGQISNSGYGRLMVSDGHQQTRIDSAQQISYIAFIDTPADGMMARQVCGNRLCVNPQHLQLFDARTRSERLAAANIQPG
jgi:hypothetical protein